MCCFSQKRIERRHSECWAVYPCVLRVKIGKYIACTAMEGFL